MLLTRIWIAALVIVMLAACSKHQPPVQMMAEARAAIQAAHDLKPSSTSANTMNQADIALRQAALALGHRNYGQARKSAQTARDLARQVIQQSQQAN